MTDEEIKQTIAKIKTRRECAYIDPAGRPSEYDGRIAFGQVGWLLKIIDDLSNKLAEQEKELTAAHNQIGELLLKAGHQAVEIERLKAIEKAAGDVCYYQGTEGSAERLERLLGYSEEQGK